MYLIINNAILPNFVGLVKDKKLTFLSFSGKKEILLKIIAKFIEKNKIDIKKIQGIIIISDSSTFSGLRIILTIANIFGKFLDIPLSWVKADEVKTASEQRASAFGFGNANAPMRIIIEEAIKIGKRKLKKGIILPVYHKEPNITTTRTNAD